MVFCLSIVDLSGDTDGRVPVLSTRYSLSILGLPITKRWRPWYHEKEVRDHELKEYVFFDNND